MGNIVRSGTIALVFLAGIGPALAQSDQGSSSSSAGDQFKSAGQNISSAAQQIGEGIKQGAVHTWEAVKAGASAAADKFNGPSAAPPKQAPSDGAH